MVSVARFGPRRIYFDDCLCNDMSWWLSENDMSWCLSDYSLVRWRNYQKHLIKTILMKKPNQIHEIPTQIRKKTRKASAFRPFHYITLKPADTISRKLIWFHFRTQGCHFALFCIETPVFGIYAFWLHFENGVREFGTSSAFERTRRFSDWFGRALSFIIFDFRWLHLLIVTGP